MLAAVPCSRFDEECAKKLESGWSVLESADNLAGLAGTIASILFAVVGLILVVQSNALGLAGAVEPDAQARRSALRLLLPNLLAMFVASLLFGLVAGELTYQRAAIMALPAAGLLGTSAVGTFVAITWSLKAYVRDHGTKAIAGGVWVSRFAWLVAGTQVWLTAVNAGHYLGVGQYLNYAHYMDWPRLPMSWLWAWDLLAALGFAVVVLLISLIGRRAKHAAGDDVPRMVKVMSSGCLVLIAAVLVIYNVAALRRAQDWAADPQPWLWAVAGATSVVVTVTSWGLLRSLPKTDLDTKSKPPPQPPEQDADAAPTEASNKAVTAKADP